MGDRYAVIGHPVAHSLSPDIHAAFARACDQDLQYERLLAPLDGFRQTVTQFRASGGQGANVTVPFKEEAFRLADRLSDRARSAGAVNTLRFDGPLAFGDNTDGAGLVADLHGNLGTELAGRGILLIGAGGAARGVLQPLLAQRPRHLVIVNRTLEKAQGLAAKSALVQACAFSDLAGRQFDVLINATSASLSGELPPLPSGLFAPGALAYDMMYGKYETSFIAWARAQGAARLADGLGMLVEQAAESFFLWRGLRPHTAPVLAMLRSKLQAR